MPVHYHIEATSRCNLKCRFCPYREISNKPDWFGDISPELFEKILNQIADYPPPQGISLHLGGEPLLHPQIDELVRITHRILKIKPMFASNGTLLTLNAAEKIASAGGAEIIIDFSADREVFEQTRTGANWEKVRHNILAAISLGDESNISIYIRSLDRDMDRLKNVLGEHKNLYFTEFELHNVGGDFAQVVENEFGMKIERKKYYVCTHPWFGMAITWDGKAVICCRDVVRTHIVGDVKKSSLKEIWFGDEMRKIRKLLVSGKIEQLPLCRTCSRPWEKKNSVFNLVKRYFFNLG